MNSHTVIFKDLKKTFTIDINGKYNIISGSSATGKTTLRRLFQKKYAKVS